MFDVVYLDRKNHRSVLASGLERTAAVDLARLESRRRHVGRMFLAGSEPKGEIVVIVESPQTTAA